MLFGHFPVNVNIQKKNFNKRCTAKRPMNVDEAGKHNCACGVHVKYDYRRLEKRYYMTRFEMLFFFTRTVFLLMLLLFLFLYVIFFYFFSRFGSHTKIHILYVIL